jgi:TonB-linked SusC/RagA family outer membrane protein
MKKHFLLMVLVILGLAGQLFAQDKLVTGKVTNSQDDSPLPGVTVSVKGSTQGTTTDSQGSFKISVPSGKSLIFSSVGFTQKTVQVGSQTTINVKLDENTSDLEEVVVTGLASSIKRSNAANAISVVKAEQLTGTTKPPYLDNAMQGKVVGANIVANSGAPGGGISVRLRGISSINLSTEPLYVIDGVIIDNSQFNTGAGSRAFSGATTTSNVSSQDQATNRVADINPADIESMEILKGPAAAAMYGTRANAGVIVITTKRGKAGETKINLSQDIGVAQAQRFLGSSNWNDKKIDTFFEGYGIGGYTAEDYKRLLKEANGRTWDYEKLFFGETPIITNTRLNISGGNDKTRFFISGGLNSEPGIMQRTGYGRRSIRLNLDQKFNDRISLGVSSNFINSNSSRSFTGNDNNGVAIGYNIAYIPNFIDLTQRPDGTYPVWGYTGQNPFEIRDKTDNLESTNRTLQSANLNIDIIRKENSLLKLNVVGGLDYFTNENEVYVPDYVAYQQQRANPGASRVSKSRALYSYLQSFLTYSWKVGKVDLQTQAGAVRNIRDFDLTWVQGEGLLPNQRNPLTGAVRVFDQFFQKTQEVAVDFNQEFNWNDKLIGRVGYRMDRSSLNGDNTKWYGFPRASLAINLTKFDFLNTDKINLLKPRFAFGQTGGVPAFGDIYSTLDATIIGGQLGSVTPTTVGNGGLAPERAQEIEAGVDVGLFGNRLNLELTFYNKTIFDFLNPYTLSPGSGVTSIKAFAVGDFENVGTEISLTGKVIEKKDLSLVTTLAFWNNKTTITRLTIPETFAGFGFGAFGRNRLRQGASPTAWYGTPNVNGQPTQYADAQPKYQMSLNTVLKWKNFDFSMLWHTSQGNHNSNLNQELRDEGGNTLDWMEDSDGDGIVNPLDGRLFGINASNNTSVFVQDASYIRLREIAVYYTVPKSFLQGAFGKVIKGAKLGISAQNPITITNYFGYDPESSNFGNRALGFGVDLTPYPSVKRTFFHLSLDF